MAQVGFFYLGDVTVYNVIVKLWKYESVSESKMMVPACMGCSCPVRVLWVLGFKNPSLKVYPRSPRPCSAGRPGGIKNLMNHKWRWPELTDRGPAS